MKIVNIVLMVLMGLLAIREGMDIVQHGEDPPEIQNWRWTA